MAFDWDIGHSSLATGSGLPWGAPADVRAGMPGTPITNIDPNTMPAFNQTGMVKNIISGLRNSQAQQNLGAQRNAAQMGAGNSNALGNQLQEISADTQNRALGAEQNAAKETWASQVQQAQNQEANNLANYKNQLSAWATGKQLEQNQQDQRNKQIGGLVDTAVNIGKAFL